MAYGDGYGYDDDDEDEDELMEDGAALKDAVLICIDASASMQTLRSAEAIGLAVDGDEQAETSFFAGALDCAFQLEKRKAFVSPGDYVGIVVYNTTKAIDEHPDAEASGIYVLHTLGPIDVDRCRSLKELVEKSKSDPAAFKRAFPPMDQDHEHRVTPAELFSYASSEMRSANLKKGNRRIFLITDDDDPCRVKAEREAAEASQKQSQRLTPRKKRAGMYGRFQGPEQVTDIERTSDRIKDFMQLGAEVIPFFLAAEDDVFDVGKFWSAALMRNFAAEGTAAYGGMTAFQDLLSGLTVRQSTKRGMFTIPLTIAEDVVIGVKGFALLMEAKKPSTMALNTDGDRPVEVQRQTTYFDAKAGQELNPASYADSIRYVFQNGLLGDEDVPPELRRQDEHNARRQADLRPMDVDESDDEAGPSTKAEVKAEGSNANEFDLAWGVGLKKKTAEKAQPVVTYTKAELAQIGSCGLQPGIRVLGYQSRSCVSFERNVKAPYFIRPTEERYTLGSTRTFVAFMRCMLERDLVAIALCMFRARSTPVICALVPQEETFIPAGDPNGSQDKPPGIHVIPFPFLDDMREYPQAIQNGGALIPDEQHVQIMQKIIKKLTARAGYNPEDIPNPTLARYFAELEARAFQDEFDGEQIEDRSLPIADVMKQRAGNLIVQFQESISRDERAFMTAPAAPAKRKATGADVPAAKKQKAAPDEEEPDMADVRAAWKAGKLAKFTVKQLRPFLRHHTGTHPTGLKADLVAAVQAYFDKGERP